MSADANWQAAAAAIASAETVLAIAHIYPDGDAVGSLSGICGALREGGKRVTAVIDGGVPANLRFVPGAEHIRPGIKRGEFDLMIAIDASDVARIGEAGKYGMANSRRVINLDHHDTNTCYGDIDLVVPGAVAAAEVVFDLLSHMHCQISQDVAFALLTGLVTDTQGFRTSATSFRTMAVAQQLMQAGAPLAHIMSLTLNRRPFSEVLLWRRALASAELEDGLITANITQEDLHAAGLKSAGDGGLVSHLVNVDAALLSIVFKELLDNQVEVSFRSKPGVDVASLAERLGGGGHKQASGCTISGSLAQVRERVMALARLAIDQGKANLA